MGNNFDDLKQRVARYALKYISDQTLIGLGHGSTAHYFARELASLPNAMERFRCACVSSETKALATDLGLKIIPDEEVNKIEIYVDGADEVTRKTTMIKGGGGAMLRERIAASIADFRVCLIDETKLHEELGAFPLPVEVSPDGTALVVASVDATLRNAGYDIEYSGMRTRSDGSIYITDNNNPIYDVKLRLVRDPERLGDLLKSILGVLDHGLFVGLFDVVCVIKENGNVFEMAANPRLMLDG